MPDGVETALLTLWLGIALFLVLASAGALP